MGDIPLHKRILSKKHTKNPAPALHIPQNSKIREPKLFMIPPYLPQKIELPETSTTFLQKY